jgi:hypothetical protein
MKTATRSQKRKMNATTSFENEYMAAQIAVDEIRDLLFELPTPGIDAIHWGHVGSLEEANRLLCQVMAILSAIQK